jgi:predicted site-specific integrase-resolvase
MSLTKNWYAIDEAASKYGLSMQQLQEWVDNGLVRTESSLGKVTLLNSDDIEQKLNLTPSV